MTPPLLPDPPAAADAEDLFETADIVLDANVVLNLYRMSAATRDAWFEVLEGVRERLVMPHHVAVEITRNAERGRKELPDAYDSLRGKLDAVRQHPGATFTGARHLQAERIAKLKAIVEKHLEPMLTEIDAAREQDEAILAKDRDVVMSRLDRIFEGRVLDEPEPSSIRRRVARFDQYRGPNRVPPGWRDHGKDVPQDAAGDYLIWAEMLERARRTGRRFIVVTDDLKADWWVRDNGMRPQPAMVAESIRATGHPHAQVTSQDFLTIAQKSLALDENEAAVEETAEVALEPDEEVWPLASRLYWVLQTIQHVPAGAPMPEAVRWVFRDILTHLPGAVLRSNPTYQTLLGSLMSEAPSPAEVNLMRAVAEDPLSEDYLLVHLANPRWLDDGPEAGRSA
ncbi:hypothetical protein CHO01_40100 [Cellulomonas hominis]|uniref:PIN like domain-containing protein n=1 Tax=Cellulomonas hominis TaxID=156981 RepID=A0A511FJZ6_9CELL|nr:hypothetical protein [Cellulomonas hominis]GEL48894.1 hypothetical protein CHO01_40100 [Cellulomonas hominis]